MRERNLRGGLALLLLVSATSANAEGFYVDAGAFRFRLKSDGFINHFAGNQYSSTLDGDDEYGEGWRVAAGYRISPHLAVEAGFADFGDVNLTPDDTLIEGGNSHATYLSDARASIKGSYLALIGLVPVGRWDAFAKIGVLRAATDTTSRIRYYTRWPTVVVETVTAASADTTELLFGAGVAYNFSEHLGAGLEATGVPNVGDSNTGADTLTSLTLSARYRF